MRKSVIAQGAAPRAYAVVASARSRVSPDALRWLWIASALVGCALLALLARLPFLAVPLTQDEGGYAYVARLWAGGARLYDDAWVDRPQGLMLIFRLIVSFSSGTVGMRLFGAIYAALCALALAYVAWRLYGRGAAFVAAALYAVFSSSPEIEGFIVNGELLATLPAILAVAAVLKARRDGRDGRWLYVAGLCAGIALMMKQSSIDSAAAVLCGAVAIAGQRHERLRRLLVVAAGIATVLLLSAAHGALTGWQRYLDAVVLDNLRYRSAESVDSPLSRALTGFKYLWSGDAALVVAAMAGIVPALGHRASDRWLPVPWLAAAGVGVTLGGLYNRHYFVQLLPPLCLLAAAGLVCAAHQARREPLARALLVALCTVFGVTIVTQAPYYAAGSALDVSKHLYNWPEYNYQDDLVSFVQTYVPADAPVYVAFAAPELHYLSGHPSITRYLWRRPLGELPGAYDSVLRSVNSATGGPYCVIIAQDVTREPGDERMRQAILHHYQKVWTRPGMSIYCHARRP